MYSDDTVSFTAMAAGRSGRMTMKSAMIVVLSCGLVLAGCATDGSVKQSGGTLLGAVGGAIAGSQFGSGNGKLAATAAGTLLGAFLGGEVGRSLDRADRAAVDQAHFSAQAAPIGERINWSNPRSGNYGTVTPVREGTSASGAYCREFQQTVHVGGQTQQGFGTACRQPDGSWKIVQ
jgi:surface antigen